jgi:hypothetical protein
MTEEKKIENEQTGKTSEKTQEEKDRLYEDFLDYLTKKRLEADYGIVADTPYSRKQERLGEKKEEQRIEIRLISDKELIDNFTEFKERDWYQGVVCSEIMDRWDEYPDYQKISMLRKRLTNVKAYIEIKAATYMPEFFLTGPEALAITSRIGICIHQIDNDWCMLADVDENERCLKVIVDMWREIDPSAEKAAEAELRNIVISLIKKYMFRYSEEDDDALCQINLSREIPDGLWREISLSCGRLIFI